MRIEPRGEVACRCSGAAPDVEDRTAGLDAASLGHPISQCPRRRGQILVTYFEDAVVQLLAEQQSP